MTKLHCQWPDCPVVDKDSKTIGFADTQHYLDQGYPLFDLLKSESLGKLFGLCPIHWKMLRKTKISEKKPE